MNVQEALDTLRSLGTEQKRRLLIIATKCPVHKVLAGEAHVNVAERLEAA